MSVYGPAGEKIGAGEVQGQPTLMSTIENVTRWWVLKTRVPHTSWLSLKSPLSKSKSPEAEAPHICAQCRPVVHVSLSVLRTQKQEPHDEADKDKVVPLEDGVHARQLTLH